MEIHRYRIKEITKYNETRFYPQVFIMNFFGFIVYWNLVHPNYSFDVYFDTIEKAEKFILDEKTGYTEHKSKKYHSI